LALLRLNDTPEKQFEIAKKVFQPFLNVTPLLISSSRPNLFATGQLRRSWCTAICSASRPTGSLMTSSGESIT